MVLLGNPDTMVNVCFVCLGNICRSPTAEAVFRALVEREGLTDRFHIESAGTSGYHLGAAPDRRSAATARARGIHLAGHAQQFTAEDFERFDHVLAMDGSNLEELLARAPDAAARAKVALLRSFDPTASPGADVPDPYYGGPRGFEDVLEICERACAGLLVALRTQHGL